MHYPFSPTWRLYILSEGGIAVKYTRFGSDINLDFFLDKLECQGTEASLFDCEHPGIFQVGTCYRSHVTAGLICGTPGRVIYVHVLI